MMWQPVSGCGDHCLDGAGPHVRWIRQVLRLVSVALVLLSGFLLIPLLRGAALRGICRALLAGLGIKVVRRGPAVRPGSLLVANHVSWLDIVALLATSPARLVAKG